MVGDYASECQSSACQNADITSHKEATPHRYTFTLFLVRTIMKIPLPIYHNSLCFVVGNERRVLPINISRI